MAILDRLMNEWKECLSMLDDYNFLEILFLLRSHRLSYLTFLDPLYVSIGPLRNKLLTYFALGLGGIRSMN